MIWRKYRIRIQQKSIISACKKQHRQSKTAFDRSLHLFFLYQIDSKSFRLSQKMKMRDKFESQIGRIVSDIRMNNKSVPPKRVHPEQISYFPPLLTPAGRRQGLFLRISQHRCMAVLRACTQKCAGTGCGNGKPHGAVRSMAGMRFSVSGAKSCRKAAQRRVAYALIKPAPVPVVSIRAVCYDGEKERRLYGRQQTYKAGN